MMVMVVVAVAVMAIVMMVRDARHVAMAIDRVGYVTMYSSVTGYRARMSRSDACSCKQTGKNY